MDKQLALFKELASTDPFKAQVVGRNLFLKNMADVNIFKEYFTFSISVSCNSVPEAKFFVEEAEHALQLFCDACEINAEVVNQIFEWRDLLYQKEEAISAQIQAEIINSNDTILKKISDLQGKLASSKSPTKILDEIRALDASLDKDMLDNRQMAVYGKLSDKLSSYVVKAQKKESKKTNLNALGDLHHVLDEFNKEGAYKKDEEKLSKLLKSRMFNIDLSIVVPEVVTYYNHVYATIL